MFAAFGWIRALFGIILALDLELMLALHCNLITIKGQSLSFVYHESSFRVEWKRLGEIVSMILSNCSSFIVGLHGGLFV